MEKKELLTESPKIPEYKKQYNSPKIEKMGDIRDLTRGSGGVGVDLAGQQDKFGQNPSDVT